MLKSEITLVVSDFFYTFAPSNKQKQVNIMKITKKSICTNEEVLNDNDNRIVRIGTKIIHTTFSGASYKGVVQHIELCNDGEKYGWSVSSMPIDNRSHNYVLDLDNDHWCYGDQVLNIIE